MVHTPTLAPKLHTDRYSRGSLTISLKNRSFNVANRSPLPSLAPPLSVELSRGSAGMVVVVVVGATMGSWFLLKMFLMVAEGRLWVKGIG